MNKKWRWSLAIVALLVVMLVGSSPSFLASQPVVNTGQAKVQGTSATLTGKIQDEGGKEITRYGFRWGTSRVLKQVETASTLDDKGSFSARVSDLQAGRTYYYQVYALNAKGTGSGQIKSFTVADISNHAPVISLSSPVGTTAVTQGNVVHIQATGEDDNQVEAMGLQINGVQETRSDGQALAYEWNTDNISPGEYSLKITAWDGEKAGEKVLTVAVQPAAGLTQKSEAVASNPSVSSSSKMTVATVTPANNTNVSRGSQSSDRSKYNKQSKNKGSYGQFWYRELSGGRIEVDPEWIRQNIVTITLPGLNQKVQVHKNAADNFIQAFTYIKNGTATINGKQVPLLSLINTMDGTWVTRHVNWNSSRGLSNHSWGAAIDINASNHFRKVYAASEPNDPNLILWEKAFKPAGFSWGNSYSDSMHYELLD